MHRIYQFPGLLDDFFRVIKDCALIIQTVIERPRKLAVVDLASLSYWRSLPLADRSGSPNSRYNSPASFMQGKLSRAK
jgi:hypothetical protein